MRPVGQATSSAAGLPTALLGLLTVILPFATPALVRADSLGSVLASHKDLSTYYGLIQEYPDILLELPSYAGVTIIAPTNDAFNKSETWDPKNKTQVTNILQYHVLQGTVATGAIPEGPSTFAPTLLTNTSFTNVTDGQNVIVSKQAGDVVVFTSGGGSRSTLLEGDIAFSGGLIQIVDTLLVPPVRLEPTMRDSYTDLTAFLGALYAADLVTFFAETPNVTIFAPSNAAFQRVSDSLSNLTSKSLARILRYHLVPGTVFSSVDLYSHDGPNVTSSAASWPNGTIGVPLRITRSGNNLYVDSAQLVQPDILLANGVVQMIDNVLNPDAYAAAPDVSAAAQAPVFPVIGSDTSTGDGAPTPFTSALPCTRDCPVTARTAAATTAASGSAAATATTSSTSLRTTSKKGGAAGPMCTGIAAGVGAGLIGMGVQMGVLGLV